LQIEKNKLRVQRVDLFDSLQAAFGLAGDFSTVDLFKLLPQDLSSHGVIVDD
jgi:hypothetical protein